MTPTARFAVFLTTVLGIWTAQHLYVGWRLLRLPGVGERARPWIVAALAFLWLSYPLARVVTARLGATLAPLELLGAVWMGLLLLLLVSLLIVDVVTVFGAVLRPYVGLLRVAAVIVAVAAGLAALIGGLRPPRVIGLDVRLDALPSSLDGTRVLQISDLHVGSVVGRRSLAATARLVDRLRPDLVAVVGDVIDPELGELERYMPLLRSIRAPLGTYCVLGNHELYAGAERSRGILEESGYAVLDNEAVEVGPGLWIAGVPDAQAARQTGSAAADLDTALAGIDRNDPSILLQHAPHDEIAAAEAGVDVMLNGHTHGGQIWPFNLIVRLAYPHVAGVYRVDGMVQVVSRGAGCWGPPMRLFAPAEVVLITLHSGRAIAPGPANDDGTSEGERP